MFRNQQAMNYCSDDDDELPFEIEEWSNDEESSDSSRPGNPLPKLLCDESDTSSDEYDRACQKRLRIHSTDSSLPMTSSGERWQFQKVPSFLLPHCSTSEGHKNLFSSSYLVPLTEQATFFEPALVRQSADVVVDVFRDLDIDTARDKSQCKSDLSPVSRATKKSRVSLQSDNDDYTRGKRRLWRTE
jgi:hypothetical protein